MTQVLDATLRDRLDLLARKADRYIAGCERRRVADRAVLAGMRASAIVPAGALLVAAMRTVSWLPVVAAAILVPLLVVAGSFLRSSRIRPARPAALALVDRRLALGDRAVVASEFVDTPHRHGFHEATLHEAAPWLDGAIDRPIAREAKAPPAYWRAWPFPVAGLGLLALAVIAGRPASDTTVMDAASRAAGSAAVDAAGDVPATSRLAVAIRRMLAALPRGGAGGIGGGSAAGDGNGGDPARYGSGGASARAGSDAATQPSGAGAGAEGGGSGGRAGLRGAAGAGVSAIDGSGSAATDPATFGKAEDAGAPTSALPPKGDGREAARTSPGAAAPGAAGWPGGAMPSAAGRSGTPREGSGASGNRRSSSSSGQGDNGASNSRAGQNQGGPGSSGQDSIKRSRGLAGLILAVPMEDKLIGTLGPGPARTSLRRSEPVTGGASAITPGSRGGQNGSVGQASHRVASRQDDRLIARYFDRNGAGTGDR